MVNTQDVSEEIAALRDKTFNSLIWIAGALGYCWLMWLVWPVRPPSLASEWLGCVVLLGVVVSGSYLVNNRQHQAYIVLVGGTLVSAYLAALSFQATWVLYGFIVPILFASALYRTKVVLSLTILVSILIVYFGAQQSSIDTLTPLVVQWLAVTILLLTKRDLYTALEWALHGYQEAKRNQQVARERQAELKRVLKALDTATYNLERANYMLGIARDKAEDARRIKQQFAQNISHELRTPLNLVVGFTETMVQSPEYYGTPLPPTYLQDLNTVYRNACHLQDLVNDVLDLARIEAAQLSLVMEPTDVTGLVHEAIAMARNLIERRGLELRLALSQDLPVLVADPVRIRQVLVNLLNNAARFTDEGHVTISAQQQNGTVTFTVSDTGVGIAPEDLTRVFEAFQQVDGTMQRRYQGAGLGLTICKHIVELHGGQIWVDSRVGEGSTFHFTLPVKVSARGDELSYVAREEHSFGSQKRQQRILLAVTKSPSAAVLLTRYLQACRSLIVNDYEQAYRVAQKTKPQIVVIDSNSSEFMKVPVETLALDWGLPKTLFITCPLPGEERLRQATKTDAYLIKPVTQHSLWDTLRQFEANVDRILVVDDDRDFVRLMSRLLDNPLRQYQVYSAYTGREALDMAVRYKPDLVLLDIRLPDIDGLEVLTRLRNIPDLKDIPIVIVSAQDEQDMTSTLRGPTVINRLAGTLPGEIIRWVQAVLDTSTTLEPLVSRQTNGASASANLDISAPAGPPGQ